MSGVYSIGGLDVVAFGESLYLFYCKWRDCGHLVGYVAGFCPLVVIEFKS